MPIIFYCQHCFERVTTPNTTAGKKGMCPFCEKIMDIPKISDMTAPSPPTSATAPTTPVRRDVDDPFDAPARPTAWSNGSHLAGQTDQPEVGTSFEQRVYGTPEKRAARAKIWGPGIGLLIVTLSGVLSCIGTLLWILVPAAADGELFFSDATIAILTVSGFTCLLEGLILTCAVDMLKLDSWRTAKTGAVFAIIPLCPWFIVTLPFGIWALAVLADETVKREFRSKPSKKRAVYY